MSLSWPVSWKRSFLRSLKVLDRRSRSFRPQLEALEERLAPSIDLVTISADSGKGSLRAVLASANAGDTIEFQLPNPSTIALTSGTLMIDKSLTILGPGMTSLTINGAGQSQSIFKVQPGVSVTISALRIQGGTAAQGAGIFDAGQLTLKTVGLTSNVSAGSTAQGGGIYVARNASLLVVGSTFKNNEAKAGGGAAIGGAIYATNAAKVTLSKDRFTSNRATANLSGNGAAQGGGIFVTQANLMVVGSRFKNNIAHVAGTGPAQGGAIAVTDPAAAKFHGKVTLKNSDRFSSNQALGGPNGGSAQGGGVYVTQGSTLGITGSSFNFNQALTSQSGTAQGGAVAVTHVAAVTVSAAHFTSNRASVLNGDKGTATGGGLYAASTNLLVVGSLFAHSLAYGAGSGSGEGGALAVSGASKVTLKGQDRFTSNDAHGGRSGGAGQGGGVYWTGSGALTISDAIFQTNSARGGSGEKGASGSGPSGGGNGKAGGKGGVGGTGGDALGGGLYVLGPSALTATLTSNTFLNNATFGGTGGTGGTGGAGSQPDIKGKTVGGAGGDGGSGGTGGAAQGGGIYWAGGSANLVGGTWTSNRAIGGNAGNGGQGGAGGTGAHATAGQGESVTGKLHGGHGGTGGSGGQGGQGRGGGLFWAGATGSLSAITLNSNSVTGGRGGNGGNAGQGGNGGDAGNDQFAGTGGTGGTGGDGSSSGAAQGGGIFWESGSALVTGAAFRDEMATASLGGQGAHGGAGGNGGQGGVDNNNGYGGPGSRGGTGGSAADAEGGDLYLMLGSAMVSSSTFESATITNGAGGQGGNGGKGGDGTKHTFGDGQGGAGGNSGNGGNAGNAFGGAIFSSGTLRLTEDTFSANQVQANASAGAAGPTPGKGGSGHDSGGKPGHLGSAGSGGSAGGGALDVNGGTAHLLAVTLANNQAISSTLSYGGGIFAAAYLSMTNSTVSGNAADHGGGLDINNTTNTQGGYALLLTNVTIAGNSASALGGGLDFESSPVHLTNTIIADNTAVAGNDNSGPDLFGYVKLALADDILVGVNAGFTIDQSDNHNQLGVDPDLGPLRQNGGPTQTMALLSTSPAINAGDNNAVPADIINDQRGPGYVRIFDNIVDLGAYEYQPFSTTVALASGQSNPTSQSPIQFTVTFGAAVNSFTNSDVTLSGTAGAKTVTVSGIGPSYTVSISGMIQSGTVLVSVPGGVVTDGLLNPNAPSNPFTVTYMIPTPLGLTAEYAASVPVGSPPTIPVLDAQSGATLFTLTPLPAAFTGGVNVAVGCGLIVTGAGAGGGPIVNVYDGTGKLLFDQMAFDPSFTGGVTVAVGYLHGDGVPYVIVGAGVGGGPAVSVYNGQTGSLVETFFAFDPTFTGGVTVAAGDVTGSGAADIIVGAGLGGGPVVAIFSGQDSGIMLHEFFAFDPSFTGGVTVAALDLTLSGHADIIVGAGPGGGAFVIAYDGATLAVLDSFFAYAGSLGGVRVAQGGFNSAGQALIRTGQGPGTSANGAQNYNALLVVNLDSFFAFDPHAGKFTAFTPT